MSGSHFIDTEQLKTCLFYLVLDICLVSVSSSVLFYGTFLTFICAAGLSLLCVQEMHHCSHYVHHYL